MHVLGVYFHSLVDVVEVLLDELEPELGQNSIVNITFGIFYLLVDDVLVVVVSVVVVAATMINFCIL